MYWSGMLSDLEIKRAVALGDIEISPYNPENLNITSYDLTLGKEVRVYSRWVWSSLDKNGTYQLTPRTDVLDSAEEPQTLSWEIPEEGIVLQPGIGYLMHTHERVCTSKFNPILDGKSSIARLFIQVHFTAGYIDPAFNGQYTLEVMAQHPVRIYRGMRICQVRFDKIDGSLGRTYQDVGHYVGASSTGAVASHAWKQLAEMRSKQ